MSKIKLMSESLANKISAGEVVEKCASVVKELVENSIDAKASNIVVSLINGGLNEIKVIDNGTGMDEVDAKNCFLRHATSKIYKEDDLFFIETLGFRGEALASIASVSEVDLTTCMGNVGTHIIVKGGKIITQEASQSKKGTCIIVRNLFYNTPARLKFLKSEVSELNNCTAFIEKLSMATVGISFTLINNGKTIMHTSGSNNLLKCIHEIYGGVVSSNMLELNVGNDDFYIHGFISKPSVLKKNKNYFNIFINNRIVKNNEINRCIDNAYNTYKHEGFYPVIVLNIQTDPTLVDVNIHPTKQDVKISKMTSLNDLLYKGIKDCLYENLLIPSVDIDEEGIDEVIVNEEKVSEVKQITMDFTSKDIVKNEEVKALDLYVVGQVHKTYIIAQDDKCMYIIDQHAAHERINYEMIMKKVENKQVYTTDLLVPITMEFSASDYAKFMEYKYVLEDLGFKFDTFGINTIIIKSHPTWIKKGYENDNIRYIIDLLLEQNKNFDKMKFLDSAIKMASCKMSVKAGDYLSMEQMQKLLKDLVKCDNPYNCCHGRPAIMKYDSYTLEKMFKRVL